MLGNQVELWETMLAAMKLGAVVIPATTLLTTADIADRIERGGVRHVVVGAGDTAKFEGLDGTFTKISVGPAEGWLDYEDAAGAEPYAGGDEATHGGDTHAPLLHLGHDRQAQARRAHLRVVPGRAICPRCTGSACARATCT